MADHPVAPKRLRDRAGAGREREPLAPAERPVPGRNDEHRDENGHEEKRVDEPRISGVVVEDHRLDHTQHDTSTERDRHRRHAGDDGDGQCAQQQAGPELPCGSNVGVGQRRTEDGGDRRESARQRPDDERGPFGADPRQARRVRVLGRGPHGHAVLRAVQEPGETADEHGKDDERDHVLGPDDHIADLPLPVEGSGEPLVGRDVGEHRLYEQEELGGADGRHHQDHLRRLAEAGHERELEQTAEEQADHGDERERRVEVPVVVDRQANEERRGERAQFAEREVDDVVRPVDEDDADRGHADGQTSHGAAEDDLVGRVERREHDAVDHGLAPRNTALARSARSASSAAGPSKRT